MNIFNPARRRLWVHRAASLPVRPIRFGWVAFLAGAPSRQRAERALKCPDTANSAFDALASLATRFAEGLEGCFQGVEPDWKPCFPSLSIGRENDRV
jgi:hypothetical protein